MSLETIFQKSNTKQYWMKSWFDMTMLSHVSEIHDYDQDYNNDECMMINHNEFIMMMTVMIISSCDNDDNDDNDAEKVVRSANCNGTIHGHSYHDYDEDDVDDDVKNADDDENDVDDDDGAE